MNKADWEKHELECINYLQQNFGMDGYIQFKHLGGSDSTKSDIAVYKDRKFLFCMDAKMESSQSGQFVLLPDEKSKTFIFSEANKSELNKEALAIINEMNNNFEKYKSPGTKSILLDINQTISANWITSHYKALKVKFFISKGTDFVIVPIDKFEDYFHIEANYRQKKSGSRNPPQKDLTTNESLLEKGNCIFNQLHFDKSYLNVNISNQKDIFVLGENDKNYQLKRLEQNLYRITKLSSTNNPNVIFQISLKRQQDPDDLEQFKAMLK